MIETVGNDIWKIPLPGIGNHMKSAKVEADGCGDVTGDDALSARRASHIVITSETLTNCDIRQHLEMNSVRKT